MRAFSPFLFEEYWWVLNSILKSSSSDFCVTKDCLIVNIDSGLCSTFQHAPLIKSQSRTYYNGYEWECYYMDTANLALVYFKNMTNFQYLVLSYY